MQLLGEGGILRNLNILRHQLPPIFNHIIWESAKTKLNYKYVDDNDEIDINDDLADEFKERQRMIKLQRYLESMNGLNDNDKKLRWENIVTTVNSEIKNYVDSRNLTILRDMKNHLNFDKLNLNSKSALILKAFIQYFAKIKYDIQKTEEERKKR